MRRSSHAIATDLCEAFDNAVRVDDAEPEGSEGAEHLDHTLDALDTAEALLEAKRRRDAERQERAKELPFLDPGNTYTAEHVANGYRVPEDYPVHYGLNGEVRIGTSPTVDKASSAEQTIITKYSDGGFAWMYWSATLVNKRGEPLRECITRYGMGGWTDKEKDLRFKVVYLNEERGHSVANGDCFIIAIGRVEQAQDSVTIRGYESNPNITRIYRSAVPADLQKFITLRELINAREDTSIPGWWFF